MTTLHKAAEKNQAATARELIAAGADVDAYDGDRTPLHCAVIFGSVDVTMVLIDNGAKVEAGDLHRLQTPLHFCADRQGHPDIADVLLSHGANIDVLDGNGNTPLYMAAAKGNLPMTEFFLARGANVNSRNHRGETPLDGANSYGHRKVVSFLQSKGGKTRREIDDEERQRKREQEKSTPSATKNASEQPKQSECFIATAACVSPDNPDVVVLSQFRDMVLRKTNVGRAVISVYQRFSPPVANIIRHSRYMRLLIRILVVRPFAFVAKGLLRD